MDPRHRDPRHTDLRHTDTDKDPAAENTLGGLLRARRAQLRPETTGLPTSGRRRVPGLRREEVATLAGVSTDYYMRLEQGRERHPSQQVLEAVARALRLDDEAVAHLYRVATPTARRTRRAPRVERVAPHLRRLLDTWSDTPAFVLGHAHEAFTVNSAPTQQLIVYQAEPGSTSADALALLGSLSAGPVPAQDTRTDTD
ncbi:helix-turn-helix domain-containing protein [Streptomyces olivochromogenes]|uniref:helix-turn-helix domain-containing protein n=1 Tax=Streptomyces olivochromogenes TaxID=1963 RepID=UPI0036786254